jgi:hypothetical protein
VLSVRSLAVAEVRERKLAEALAYANGQRMTVRCGECGWYMKNALVSDAKKAFERHLTGAKHTRRNQARGPRQSTRDRHNGMSWAK